MEVKCTRYVFTYSSSPEDIRDYILRSADLADKIYGRDSAFSRANQVITFARFLGWQIPTGAGGHSFLEYLQEEPPQSIDHIFENQCKLIADIAPTTKVTLEDGRNCSVRLLCGTTAVGDLVWKLHLLTDKEGCPYIVKNSKRYKVKTKGTQIVAQTENLNYEEPYIRDCFGGNNSAYWPVPFLPEFFSDREIAHFFSPEDGVVEVVKMYEPEPVHVLATEMVPWYRILEIDRAKALPMDEFKEDGSVDPNQLVSGWDELTDNEQFEVDEEENTDDEAEGDEEYEETTEELPQVVNLTVSLTPSEQAKLTALEKEMAATGIASKQEAETLKENPTEKDRAEKWLLSALNRVRLLANCSNKIGAVLQTLQKHQGQQILILQSRNKWAAKLQEVLKSKGVISKLYDPNHKSNNTLRKFYEGELQVLVSSVAVEDLFIDDLIIISVSSFSPLDWLQLTNESNLIYTVCIKELGYNDHNLVGEIPEFEVITEDYRGPSLDILKMDIESSQPSSQPSEIVNAAVPVEEKPKEPKPPKYKISFGKGRPKSVSSYEKALELAKKKEQEGAKCEIFDPQGEACYVSGIGELNK